MLDKFKDVILYSKNLPPSKVGGIETNALYLIKGFQKVENIRLHVVTVTSKKFVLFRTKNISFDDNNILKAHLIKKRERKKPYKVAKFFMRLGCSPETTLIYHNTLDLQFSYELLAGLGYSQVARSGGNDFFLDDRRGSSNNSLIGSISHLNLFFVNSEFSLQRAVEAGLKRNNLRIIKGGCERELPPRMSMPIVFRRPLILSCCRLVDFKGLEDAIDACRLLSDWGIRFVYAIIGDGCMREQLQARIDRHGLHEKCILVGQVQPTQVHAYYQVADVYLSSSKDVVRSNGYFNYVHTETMGRSLCEAQVHGVPVVATNVGGCPEIVEHGVTGLVVEQGNVLAIAEALRDVLQNELKRKEMSAHAALFAERQFSWGAVFERLLFELRSIK